LISIKTIILYFVLFLITVFLCLCFYALYFVALLVILSLLLVIMGGQHDGLLLLAAHLSFTFIFTYFLMANKLCCYCCCCKQITVPKGAMNERINKNVYYVGCWKILYNCHMPNKCVVVVVVL